MRDSAPAGFVDLVVARGPALHRTAVLLTRQSQAAEDLVQIALAKAWQSWARIDGNYEAYVRQIMVNEFASASRRRWQGELPKMEPAEVSPDAGGEVGDVPRGQVLMATLAALPPRQRAVVVLQFFHDYTEAATAEVLGISVSKVESLTFKALAALRVAEGLRDEQVRIPPAPPGRDGQLNPTLDDLRLALHEEASVTPHPNVDALAAAARRRVVAAHQHRMVVLGRASAALLVVAGLAGWASTHQTLPAPDTTGPFTVDTSGSGFPQFSQGMKLLTVLEAPMVEQLNSSFSVRTGAGRQLAVRMICRPEGNMENTGEWMSRMSARFTIPGRPAGLVSCAGLPDQGYALIGVAASVKTTVLADVTINHSSSPAPGLFKGAKIHVAIYESVPASDYPFPARPADLNTSARYRWLSHPGIVRVVGPKTAAEANTALTFTQPFDQDLALNMEVRGPGGFRVLLNGKDISRQVADTMASPGELVSFWRYGSFSLELPLDPALADPGGPYGAPTPRGAPVTVTIEPQGFLGPDWRVSVQPSTACRAGGSEPVCRLAGTPVAR
ncbi:MAG: SigE family RNA polymerase sigma factor [Dermatophilaceae bacterium]